MISFLENCAKNISVKYNGRFENLVIILPGKRTAFYFSGYLASVVKGPVWSPEIVTIDQFVYDNTDFELIDPIELLWDLYLVFKENEPELEFDKFSSWARTLLSDFDKIDQNRVDAKSIFNYMTQAEAIKRWEIENNEHGPSELLLKHFQLWDKLFAVYDKLKKNIAEKGKAYRGMVYSWLSENPQQIIDNNSSKRFIFIGLNFLTRSEEVIIQYLILKERAEIIWDTDKYFMEFNKDNKAGENLRKYKNSSKYGSEWNYEFENFLDPAKNINIYGVGNASTQGRLVSQLISENPELLNNSVAVLPDDNLLMPVLNNLNSEDDIFNITMGLSIRNSSLYTFINYLFELQQLTIDENNKEGKKILKFNGRNINKVLGHPYIKLFEQQQFDGLSEQENYIQNTVRHVNEYARGFYSPFFLISAASSPALFNILFSPWHGNVNNAIKCFYDIVSFLKRLLKEINNPLETESIIIFESYLKRIENIFKENKNKENILSVRSLRLFLSELFRQEKISFSSGNNRGLQLMGLLETKALDFENVIVLSCNEGSLPMLRKQNSLIPFDAHIEFGLPTYQVNESGVAYNFYRLLQRAKNIYLIYVLPSDTYGGNEKSRFIHQIENELIKYNPAIKINYKSVVLPETDTYSAPIIKIEKNPALINKIKNVLNNGISPSQINTFIECPLKYYYNSIVKVREDKEQDDVMGPDKFGEMVHRALEEIDTEFKNKGENVSAAGLEKVIPEIGNKMKKIFNNDFPSLSLDNGLNFLYYKAGSKMIEKFYKYQIENERFPIEILRIERKLDVEFKALINNEDIKIKLTGRVDRIDRVKTDQQEDEIRIIDYKTGKVEANNLKFTGAYEEGLVESPKWGKLRQLWLYKFMIAKKLLADEKYKNLRLSSGIFSFRNLKEGYIKENILFDVGQENNMEKFVDGSEKLITRIVEKILDPCKPFIQTKDLNICKFCSYADICSREVEDFN